MISEYQTVGSTIIDKYFVSLIEYFKPTMSRIELREAHVFLNVLDN